MDNEENRLWNLLARKLATEATPGELLELNSIIENSPDLQNIVNSIEIYWNEKNELINSDETEDERFRLILNAENKDEEIHDERNERSPGESTKKYRLSLAAASVLLILAMAFLLKQHFNNVINFSSKKIFSRCM